MKKKILAIVFSIGTFLAGVCVGTAAAANVLSNIIEEYRTSSDKFLRLFHLMSQWVQGMQEGKSIKDYCEKNGYKDIAIYGKGRIGEAAAKELLGTGITVKYFIDRKADKNPGGVVVSPDSKLEEVDVIIVTPVMSYGEIKQQLVKRVSCPVISIEDILYEV